MTWHEALLIDLYLDIQKICPGSSNCQTSKVTIASSQKTYTPLHFGFEEKVAIAMSN